MHQKDLCSECYSTCVANRLNIGMIDADLLDNGTRHPNLAQMKISAYCKFKGHNVTLIYRNEDISNLQQYDLLIVSKVFTFTKLVEPLNQLIQESGKTLVELNGCIYEALIQYETVLPDSTQILIGGTGFFEDGGRDLHNEIERNVCGNPRRIPDYHLYDDYIMDKIKQGRSIKYFDDYLNYSIGFMTRGCFRKCHFCVNKKYERAVRHSHVEEFLDTKRPMIYLWDDNVFAYSGWEEVFQELIETGRPFQFRQGLDIRLMTESRAKVLSQCKYHGDYIFAFDHVDDADLIIKKLTMWRQYTRKTTKLYLLCAFDPWDIDRDIISPESGKAVYCLDRMNGLRSQDERDQMDIQGVFERIEILMRLGCLPYIMRYENYKKSKYRSLYIELARWCNQPQFFKKKSFRQFCEANRDYNHNENCSSYRSMIEFEKDRPDIAKKYFDLRFEDLNQYKVCSSYGRIDTTPCLICKEANYTWNDFLNSSISNIEKLSYYYSGKLDFLCLISGLCEHCDPKRDKIDIISNQLFDLINDSSFDDLLDAIDASDPLSITKNNIPQFSGLDTAIVYSMNELRQPLTYKELGEKLPGRTSESDNAKTKYGENHAKLLALLDLVYVNSDTRPSTVVLSPVGKIVVELPNYKRLEIITKLILRIPIIQNVLRDAKNGSIVLADYLSVLEESTLIRRTGNVADLIDLLKGKTTEMDRRIDNIAVRTQSNI